MTERREQTIERLRKRNRISDDEIANVRTNLASSPDLQGLAAADLVTEAVSENAKAKLAVYDALKNAGFEGILTTNTSSITRSSLLERGAYHRQKFASTHFFNPVLHTQMVEVVRGDMDQIAFDTTVSILRTLGRQPIETQDISGFVSNSILMVYAVMALRLLECGARIEEVDQVAKETRLLPPFISFDSWKPSIVEDVTQLMFEHRGDHFLRSSKLLSAISRENPKFYINQEANEEIYQFVDHRGRKPNQNATKQALKTAIWIAAANVVEAGESPGTVDFISTEGIKIPEPPLQDIDKIGAAHVLELLASTNREISGEALSPPALLVTMAREGQRFSAMGNQTPGFHRIYNRG
jgi:3-hydroxyacyl-CoA dehydrogenase